MECVLCRQDVEGEAHYFLEDEQERYPLHRWCLNVVDLRLLLMEAAAQGEIDQFIENMEV